MSNSKLHKVEFKRNRDGDHTLTFACLGDETSQCHQYPDCSCDFWDDDHEHPKVSHVDCWLTSWFEGNGQGVAYGGDDAIEFCGRCDGNCPPKSRTGFVETIFSDDYVEWKWISK